MASNEIEILGPAATVDKLNKIAADRALNRRRFITALGMTGAAAGVGLMSGCAASTITAPISTALGAGQTDILNFALNLKYLEATFYSYLTKGADLPSSVTGNSGVIAGAPAALTVAAPMTQQTFDLLNEIYFDELSHVTGLRSILGSAAVSRPSINLAAFGAITPTNALSIARLLEDIGVTALAGIIPGLTTTNATYAAQILGAESFHSGAMRMVSIQTPSIAAYMAAADGLDVPPHDLGTATLEAAGPTVSGGFFPTYGSAAGGTTAGFAFARTSQQALLLLYGSSTALAASGATSGGFFPSGVKGNITIA
jgi:hypothetical protein